LLILLTVDRKKKVLKLTHLQKFIFNLSLCFNSSFEAKKFGILLLVC